MSDKRKVTTDALETLGTIIGNSEKRDAIHLAVEPVTASEPLEPGQHITVVNGVASKAEVGQGLGIVDPFLTRTVRTRERFWFVMYPRMVQSLRHVWTHPAFVDETAAPVVEDEKQQSERWIREWAESIPLSYETIMSGAEDWLRNGDYLNFGGLLEGEYVPDEFWKHYEIVTGEKVDAEHRGSFFMCSC